jgi:hypothetical protein
MDINVPVLSEFSLVFCGKDAGAEFFGALISGRSRAHLRFSLPCGAIPHLLSEINQFT